ncbi:biotin transporter BioY [Corynebacterium choanae]|uniref:Biotin transporter n=1 Tax=Corynebacterium choanae TaxID=1862358 RepID=A0A3G6J6T9_9CORY|nr:biotin transporter BioY [Corynebacterium choanae]AZA13787.1 Biotin transporter BioY [Corynebacterium choanae]
MNDNSKTIVKDIAYSAVFAALIVALAFFSIPTAASVPIVLQNAAIILTGLILGPRRGTYAIILFFLLGLIGLPILAGGRPLLPALAGPTVGYLVGYLLTPFVAGIISAGATLARVRLFVFLALGGVAALLTQYGLGVAGLMLRADQSLKAALTAQIPFLPVDAAKLAAVIVIAFGVHLALPHLRGFKPVAITA